MVAMFVILNSFLKVFGASQAHPAVFSIP